MGLIGLIGPIQPLVTTGVSLQPFLDLLLESRPHGLVRAHAPHPAAHAEDFRRVSLRAPDNGMAQTQGYHGAHDACGRNDVKLPVR